MRKTKLEERQPIAEAGLFALCGSIIRHAKDGNGKWAAESYKMLLGACMVYLDFVETALGDYIAENSIAYAQKILRIECEEDGEDYEKIINFTLHFVVGQ